MPPNLRVRDAGDRRRGSYDQAITAAQWGAHGELGGGPGRTAASCSRWRARRRRAAASLVGDELRGRASTAAITVRRPGSRASSWSTSDPGRARLRWRYRPCGGAAGAMRWRRGRVVSPLRILQPSWQPGRARSRPRSGARRRRTRRGRARSAGFHADRATTFRSPCSSSWLQRWRFSARIRSAARRRLARVSRGASATSASALTLLLQHRAGRDSTNASRVHNGSLLETESGCATDVVGSSTTTPSPTPSRCYAGGSAKPYGVHTATFNRGGETRACEARRTLSLLFEPAIGPSERAK